ncbi:MAG TPA: lanthionine synthetase C family protein [Streptosporangiaceae bacterium]|nr:lanthionine synthetase C family protein [Streptosporangiaceae bacterium]
MSTPAISTARQPGGMSRSARPNARAQSLAQGAAGIALLHIERARRSSGSWTQAHAVLATCAHDLIVGQDTCLYFGAPSVAFAMHTAAAGTGRYARALHALDARITQLTTRRIGRAHARIERGERPRASEFDLFHGLTGLGTYLLCREPDAQVLHEVLRYLVRLTIPLDGDEEQLPGWWIPYSPSGGISPSFTGGHGNAGMAHGAAGILSLLSVAARHGTVVDGQIEAIHRICGWLDLYRQDTRTGSWWPGWINLAEHRAGTVTQPGPPRPGWCYGTAGLARAQQLAGLALNDTARQRMAERALLACLADPAQLARIRDAGICHGAAGLLHTTHRVARDAQAQGFAARLASLRVLLLEQPPAHEDGFLDGTAGSALALLTADANGTTASGWDACLLAG